MESHKACARMLILGLSLLGTTSVAYGDHCPYKPKEEKDCNEIRVVSRHYCEWNGTGRPCREREFYAYHVKLIKRHLNAKENTKLPVDGIMTKATRDAISDFERKSGFAPTGKPSKSLIDMLSKK